MQMEGFSPLDSRVSFRLQKPLGYLKKPLENKQKSSITIWKSNSLCCILTSRARASVFACDLNDYGIHRKAIDHIKVLESVFMERRQHEHLG